MKQLESYVYNMCRLCSFRVDALVSVYDVNSGKYIYKSSGLK